MLAIEPEKIHEATDEELSLAYQKINFIEKELGPEKQQIREEMVERLGAEDVKLIGKCQVSKTRRPNYAKANFEKASDLGATYAVVKLETAKELGIEYKEVLDTDAVKKLYELGADLGVPVTEYPTVNVLGDDE